MIKLTDEIIQLFQEKMTNLINNGETIHQVTTTTRRTLHYDGEGNLTQTTKHVSENKKVTMLPTPDIVYQIVDRSMSVNAALELLHNQGYVVLDPSLVSEPEKQNKGISEETVQEIRQKLLGID